MGNQGAFLGLVLAPKYATADYTAKFATAFTNAQTKIPEIQDTFMVAGTDGAGSAFIGFKLKEWSERTARKAAAIKQDIQNLLDSNAGVQAFIFSPLMLPR